ncbi:MAG: 6-carboxytetrahydropterin synthase [Saprospiraceae bacterium]|nr:6-carboxytetrahydropterin synthase [Saprospiraceae bacterium]
MRIAAIRKAHFNAAHRLHRADWDDQRNREVFGKCANPHFHGHNYDLEVKVVGELDPETGMLIDLKYLKDLIGEEVEDYFDHKNINLELEEFNTPDDRGRFLNPTAENIAMVIYRRLRLRLDARYDLFIRLYETARNLVEYPA